MIRPFDGRRVRLGLASALVAAVALLALPALAHAAGSWGFQDSGITDGTMLASVSFVDTTHGWAVGDVGTILRTSDGGAHWAPQASGVTADDILLGVFFKDATHGWAVGTNGTIVSTTNGGGTWTSRDSGITDGSGLSAVYFADTSHGWAVGDAGTVVRTTNGGATWTSQDSGITDGSNLYSVAFTDTGHGWAAGDNGTIISTTNGGATWTSQDSGVTDGRFLRAIAFVDATHGWAAGDNGTVLSTTDGGATWTSQDSGVTDGSSLGSIAFADAAHGWAVGDAGLIVATVDGGATWQSQDSGVTDGSSLYAVAVSGTTHAWAVGDMGTIVAYDATVSGGGGGVAPVPDTTPPVTTLLMDPSANAGWNSSAVTVELDAIDNRGGSGVAATYYTLDGSQQVYDSPFDVTDEGVHTLSYHSEDASGNVETEKNATIRIDATAPELSLDATDAYEGSATIRATASDTLSGLDFVETSVDGGAWTRAASVHVSTPGTHTVDVRAFDVAGNEADASATFTVVWPQTVVTATRISAPASVRVKKTLKITGTVSPAGAPGTVTITKTRLVGRKWRSAGSVTVRVVNGSFSYTFKPTARGSWRFIARYAGSVVGSTTCLASRSSTRTVKVK
jgi:photosystem II stability/assembly factor-like uncharacterized protein